MTDQEIEQKREQLVEIKKIKDKGEKSKAIIELMGEVGAAGCGGDLLYTEREALNIASIHQALQTAAMANMCKVASQGHETAVEACDTAKKSGKTMAIIAIIAAFAAWAGVIVTGICR